MKAAAVLAASAAMLAACSLTPTKDRKADQQAASTQHEPAGPVPTYQMRPPIDPAANRLAPTADGKTVFEQRCGYCHLPWGMGTNLLTKQQVALGRPPEMGLLSNRTDLSADYVKTVVREGKGAMPPQTPVDVTDAELDKIADYLGKAKPDADASDIPAGDTTGAAQ
ncbi:cytochrome c [Novosphingobium sp. ZN18A2]|uniref:c-type cytochrome n=1 Tax=Novosphingobium sp. ZN18A2 TaxID=3079861 RepID=UPI0030D46A59